MSNTETKETKRSLWERILELLEEDLAERRDKKYAVEVRGESGHYHKEIGELSPQELKSSDSELRKWVADRLLDRHLAQQGRVELLERRRAYTKKIQELTPADLPALIEADRYRAEQCHEEHERQDFVREVQEDLDRLPVNEFAEVSR